MPLVRQRCAVANQKACQIPTLLNSLEISIITLQEPEQRAHFAGTGFGDRSKFRQAALQHSAKQLFQGEAAVSSGAATAEESYEQTQDRCPSQRTQRPAANKGNKLVGIGPGMFRSAYRQSRAPFHCSSSGCAHLRGNGFTSGFQGLGCGFCASDSDFFDRRFGAIFFIFIKLSGSFMLVRKRRTPGTGIAHGIVSGLTARTHRLLLLCREIFLSNHFAMILFPSSLMARNQGQPTELV
jgi:hypothetical protein